MRFTFKQAVRFDWGRGQRKFFALGTHEVPKEIQESGYFKLLQKRGLIFEGGSAKAPPTSSSSEAPKGESKDEGQTSDDSSNGSASSDSNPESEASTEVSEKPRKRKR